MLTELSRREKAANIKPDPDLDVYMKAISVGGQDTNIITDYILKVLHPIFRLLLIFLHQSTKV